MTSQNEGNWGLSFYHGRESIEIDPANHIESSGHPTGFVNHNIISYNAGSCGEGSFGTSAAYRKHSIPTLTMLGYVRYSK